MQRPGPLVAFAALVGLGLLGIAAAAIAPDLLEPLLQAGLAIAVLAVFLLFRRARSRGLNEFFDLGTLFVSITFLYTFIPLANFVLRDGVYSQQGDSRMLILQPGPDLVARVGWHYLLFMTAFAAAYIWSQRRFRVPTDSTPKPPRQDFVVWMVGLYGACQLVAIVIKTRYALTAESYLESYRVYQDVPLFVQQSMAWLTGFTRIVEIGVLGCFFARYKRYRTIVWVWLGVIAAATFLRLHARTDLMIAIGSSVFLYHVFVRPVRLWRLAAIGLVAVLSFQALGVLRGLGGDVDDLGTHELMNSGSEFENVFGNALHVLALRDGGQLLVPVHRWYLSELAILIPQQLLPFEKIDPSNWYVRSFFPRYASMGGGYAWGAIAQSLVGFGLPEAALRGSLLALLLAAVDRFLRRRWARIEFVVIYAWLMGTVYLSMRNVTFYFVHGATYLVIPWLAACYAFRRTISRSQSADDDAKASDAVESTETRRNDSSLTPQTTRS